MSRLTRLSDAELLVAARSDPEAFGLFYERHLPRVFGFFRRRVGGPEQAFDLAAETFAAALAGLERYEPGPEPAVAWLFAIARNTLGQARRRGRVDDRLRRTLAMQPIVLDDESIELLERLGEQPAVELLERLPPDQREAVSARYVQERDYGEIAAELRCSESVVRKRASRGVARLRAELSGRPSE
jgi:RNA polymerase sigma factor (sigma-70 family)